ncbi:MAG: mannosyltransferase [Pirellulaceae bacterium]
MSNSESESSKKPLADTVALPTEAGVRRAWRFRIALMCIAVVALAIRLLQVNESLWVDELHTSWAVADDWKDVAPRAYIGNQHPLYFWLVRGIVSVAGQSEFSLRFLSLLSGVGFVVLTGAVARRFTGSELAGIVAATLVAIDREFIYFSQEARTYALVQLLGLIQVCCGYRLLYEAKLRWRFPFVGLSLLLFYLHYTTGLLLIGELTAAVLLYGTKSYRPKYSTRNLFNDFVLIGSISLLTSHDHLSEILGRRLNWKSFVTANPRADLIRHFDVYYLASLFALVPATCWRFVSKKPRWILLDPLACGLFLIAAVPIGLAWLGTYMESLPIFFYRYLVVLLFVGPLLVAIVCARLPRPWQIAFTAFVVLFAGYAHGRSTNWWQQGWIVVNRAEDWRSVAGVVDGQNKDWPVLLQAGFIETNKLIGKHEEIWGEFLSCPLRGIYRIDRADERLTAGTRNSMVLIKRHEEKLRQTDGGWLVIRSGRDDGMKLARYLVEYVAFDIEVITLSGVHVFKLTPSEGPRGRVIEKTPNGT